MVVCESPLFSSHFLSSPADAPDILQTVTHRTVGTATVVWDRVPVCNYPHGKSEWLHPATLDLDG